MRNQCGPRFNKGGVHCWGSGSEAPAAGGKGVWVALPQAANEFLRFSHKKKLVLPHFLINQGHTDTCSECSHHYSVRQYKNILVVHV